MNQIEAAHQGKFDKEFFRLKKNKEDIYGYSNKKCFLSSNEAIY